MTKTQLKKFTKKRLDNIREKAYKLKFTSHREEVANTAYKFYQTEEIMLTYDLEDFLGSEEYILDLYERETAK